MHWLLIIPPTTAECIRSICIPIQSQMYLCTLAYVSGSVLLICTTIGLKLYENWLLKGKATFGSC